MVLLVYYTGVGKIRKGGLHTEAEFKEVAKKVCKNKCPSGTKKIANYFGATVVSIKPSELKHYKKNLK
jgi:hypothetical protein